MSEFPETAWADRLHDPARPLTPLTLVEDDTAGFLYVTDRFLTTETAAAVLDLDNRPGDYLDATSAALAAVHLREFAYVGAPVDLPRHVAELRTLARAQAPSAGADPGACDVALHYAVTGNAGWVPKGHPHDAPSRLPDPAPARTWPGADPLLAVVDTGLDLTSATGSAFVVGASPLVLDPDVDADLLRMPGQVGPELSAEAGHGTFITWLVGHQTAGRVDVVNVRALDPDGVGSEAMLLDALSRVVDRHPDLAVLNLSLGGYTDATDYSGDPATGDAAPADTMPLALRAWLDEFLGRRPDAVIVCAAGNYGLDRPFWPAADERVLAVASLNDGRVRSTFSNHGSWVDACTYGEDVVADYPKGSVVDENGASEAFNGEAARWSGTSFAAPVLAAELVRQVQDARDNGTSLTAREAWNSLKATLAPYKATPEHLGLVWDPRTLGPEFDPLSL